MTPKFKEFQFVEVDGTATGYGDLVGWIKSIELSDILGEPHYQVRVYSHIDSVYVAEKFIKETKRSLNIEKLMNNQVI